MARSVALPLITSLLKSCVAGAREEASGVQMSPARSPIRPASASSPDPFRLGALALSSPLSTPTDPPAPAPRPSPGSDSVDLTAVTRQLLSFLLPCPTPAPTVAVRDGLAVVRMLLCAKSDNRSAKSPLIGNSSMQVRFEHFTVQMWAHS